MGGKNCHDGGSNLDPQFDSASSWSLDWQLCSKSFMFMSTQATAARNNNNKKPQQTLITQISNFWPHIYCIIIALKTQFPINNFDIDLKKTQCLAKSQNTCLYIRYRMTVQNLIEIDNPHVRPSPCYFMIIHPIQTNWSIQKVQLRLM